MKLKKVEPGNNVIRLRGYNHVCPASSLEGYNDSKHRVFVLVFSDGSSWAPRDGELEAAAREKESAHQHNIRNDDHGSTKCPYCRTLLCTEFDVDHCPDCGWVKE